MVVYPDGRFEVVDLDELAEAYDKGLLTAGQMHECLESLDRLIKIINEEKLSELYLPLELQISNHRLSARKE